MKVSRSFPSLKGNFKIRSTVVCKSSLLITFAEIDKFCFLFSPMISLERRFISSSYCFLSVPKRWPSTTSCPIKYGYLLKKCQKTKLNNFKHTLNECKFDIKVQWAWAIAYPRNGLSSHSQELLRNAQVSPDKGQCCCEDVNRWD